jgi:hypothetical protein
VVNCKKRRILSIRKRQRRLVFLGMGGKLEGVRNEEVRGPSTYLGKPYAV